MATTDITAQVRESVRREILRRANLQEKLEEARIPRGGLSISELRQEIQEEKTRKRASYR